MYGNLLLLFIHRYQRGVCKIHRESVIVRSPIRRILVNERFYCRFLTLIGTVALITASAIADDRDVDEPAKPGPSPPAHTLWKWSLVAYGTANALDVVSSVGPHYGHETNSLLTNSSGNFDAGKAIAVKGNVFAATGIAEYLIIRKWPQLTKLFSVVNFGWSAAEAGVAAHNFTLRK